MNKKADVGLGAIIVIILVILFLGWLINEGWKECRTDSDCGEGSYCNSEFSCNKIPVIERTVAVEPASPMNINFAIVFLGLAIIIAAIIFKWDSIFKNKGSKNERKDTKGEYIDMSRSKNSEDESLYQKFLDEKYD